MTVLAAEEGAGVAARRAGARRAKGRAKGRSRSRGKAEKLADRPSLNGMTPEEAREELEQRARLARADHDDDEHADEHDDEDHDDEHAERIFTRMEPASTGGGFLLGVMVWALVRAYIGNPGEPSGAAGVKRLLKAKFFNQTGGGEGK